MTLYHEWQVSPVKRFKAYYDDTHETRGSFAYGSDAEDKAAEDEEIRNLESGKWVVLGVICEEFIPAHHCVTCHCGADGVKEWLETDSCWGIVIENSTKALERFVENGF